MPPWWAVLGDERWAISAGSTGEWLTLSAEQIGQAADHIAKDGIYLLDAPLAPHTARELYNELKALDWNLTKWIDDKFWLADQDQLSRIGEERIQAFAQGQAEDQFRLCYDVMEVNSPLAPRKTSGDMLDALYAAWIAAAAMMVWNAILLGETVVSLRMQASRFRPAHFLTPHDDGGVESRVTAFVLSLEPDWQPHWGGQLHIDDNAGKTQVITPSHNTLTLFTVPRDYFVSQVASYAPRGRIAVSGCLMR